MKRRAMIFVLVLALMVSIFPVTASAATVRKPSSSCINLLKNLEGFAEKPFWDYKQYSVGYGTQCPSDKLDYYREHGITREEAQALLEKEMESYVDSVNKFAAKYNLKLNQHQFDALVSFTYNVGAGWTNGAATQLFTQYVLDGKTGNDFLFAMTLWSNAGGSVNTGLVKRRLIEANMYLNGVYSNSVPSNYNYVLFNHSTSIYAGKVRTVRVVGYDSKLGKPAMPEGTRSGYRFLGWYTASTGGEWINALTDREDGKTLYAHWQKDEGNVDNNGNILGTAASYTRAASAAMKIYAQPKQNAKTTGSVKRGESMHIVADYVTADDVKWGLLKQGGWVCLSGTASGGSDTGSNSGENVGTTKPPVTEKVIASGVIKTSAGSLNVRAEPNTSSEKVGYLQGGTRVELYEIKTVGGTDWGRTGKGWISLKYVNLDTEDEDPTEPEQTKPAEKVVARGMVTLSSGTLSIRAKASTSATKVGTLKNGTIVEIYEIVTAGDYKWGRMSEGWIRMDYVKAPETKTIPIASIKIRSGAGSDYSMVGRYEKGDQVRIYETKKVGGNTWGRTEKGWFNMTYAKLAAADQVIDTGKVSAATLTIRKGAGTGYDKVGTYQKNDKVKIYETKKVSSATWGRTDKGWVNLAYVKLDSAQTEKVIDTGRVTSTTLAIRKAAGSDKERIGTYNKNDKINIYETKKVGSATWGRTDKGWVNLAYTKLDSAQTEQVMDTGKVTANILNIRKGAGTSYDKIGTYQKNDKVKIYETKKVGSATWGRTDKGWIDLANVKLDSDQTEKVIATGKITADALRIRKGAGNDYEVVGSYQKGETVKIYETTKTGAVTWGRTEKGWISMTYVQTNDDTASTAVTRTGTVTASGTLTVRKGAGTGYDKVGSVSSGAKLTITALKLVKDSAWGKISDGWVCLDHVKLDKPAAGAPALTMGSDLNIRKGAGTSYDVVDRYGKGVVVTILQTKTVSGTTWGRTDKGWVSMDYVL